MEANANYGDEIRMTSGGKGGEDTGRESCRHVPDEEGGGEKVELCQAQRAYMHHI